MLVFSRKRNEEFVIGNPGAEVRVVVVEIRGDKVRLGIEADPGVPVHRREVFDAIHRNDPPPLSDATPAAA
jgi:carbon storage regulator